jgi:hypothetical protein
MDDYSILTLAFFPSFGSGRNLFESRGYYSYNGKENPIHSWLVRACGGYGIFCGEFERNWDGFEGKEMVGMLITAEANTINPTTLILFIVDSLSQVFLLQVIHTRKPVVMDSFCLN